MNDKDIINYFDEYDETLLVVFNTAKSLKEKNISLAKENKKLKEGVKTQDVISSTLINRLETSRKLLKSIVNECESLNR